MTAKKDGPRAIGRKVIEAVEALERRGEACFSAGRPQKDEPRERAPGKALRRAVEYGLVSRSNDKPYRYRAVQDWREMLSGTPSPKFARISRPIASVFDMAQSLGTAR